MPTIVPEGGAPVVTDISTGDVKGLVETILHRVVRIVQQQKRSELLNERFLHHMFAWELGKLYERRGLDMWDHLLLAPECPSDQKFRWDAINLDDDDATRLNAIGDGKCGNLDFLLKVTPAVAVEWKGPVLYQPQDVVEALLKLVTQQPGTTKVFAAVITSSITGRKDHMEKAGRYFREAVECVKRVRQLQSFDGINLHAYIATVPDRGAVKLHWGAVQ